MLILFHCKLFFNKFYFPFSPFQTDGNASFLRAARAGNLEKVLEYLKGNIDINTSNSVSTNCNTGYNLIIHLSVK